MQSRNLSLALVALAAPTILAGCPSNDLAPIEPCTVAGLNSQIEVDKIDEVDVLFVIDNSNSMQEEQVTLARELPRMVQILASGDRTPETDADNNDEGVTFPPVKSLHLGVVSTNMGANGNAVPGCMGTGDDGLLLAGAAADDPNCAGAYPQYLQFAAVDDEAMNLANATALGDDFACVSQLGTSGCGLEQQLEAALKAVAYEGQNIDIYDPIGTPEPLTFSGNTFGHGAGAHLGFLRDNSVIAIIVVSDEDDCSIPDASRDLFSLEATSQFAEEPLNLRCGLHSDPSDPTLHPIQRYAAGLKGLRPDRPEQVIFATIAGVPPDLGEQLAQGQLTIPQLLEQPAMQFAPADDPVVADTLPVASCNTAAGVAFPPRRLVAVADQFNEPGGIQNGVVRSICEDDYGPALDAIILKIASQLDGACLQRVLIADDTGRVQCDIIEVAAASDPEPCSTPGRTMVGVGTLPGEEGRTLCLIDQVPVVSDGAGNVGPEAGGVGWYYDDFDEQTLRDCGELDTDGVPVPQSGRKIAFTATADPPAGARIRFDCEPPVFSSDPAAVGKAAAGVPCPTPAKPRDPSVCTEGNMNAACITSCGQLSVTEANELLYCVAKFQTCQLACNNNADCPGSWVCDFRQGDIAEDLQGMQGYCANPTCPALRPGREGEE